MAKKAAKTVTKPVMMTAASPRPAESDVSPVTGPTLRDVIIRAIEDSGKSVRSIALNAGISQPQLSRFVKGERDLRLDAADKVAKSLGLELRKFDG